MNLPSLTEAVARAICLAWHDAPDDALTYDDGSPVLPAVPRWTIYETEAQAAIQTIIAGLIKAGASEAMYKAGLDYIDREGPGSTVSGIYLVCLRVLAVDLGLEIGE